MYCAKCGKEIREGLNFCPNCGNEVKRKKSIKERAREKDASVWEEIYNQTYAKAYSVAIQIVKNQEDAMDVLQEAYISAFKSLESLQDEKKLNAWINMIVANRCKDWLRKNKAIVFSDMGNEDANLEFEDSLENEHEEFMPEESIDYSTTKELMQEILNHLSEDQRLCVLMYYYDEMSVGDIAETLECSTGTIKSRLNYARKYIKKEVVALEKKGTKLYGIAPIPFIVWMLRDEEASITAHVAGTAVWAKIQTTAVQGIPSAISEGSSSSTASGVVETATSVVGQAAGQVVQHGVRHVVLKITAGIIAVIIAATGGAAVYHYTHTDKSVETKKISSKPEKKESTKEENEQDNDEHLQTIVNAIENDPDAVIGMSEILGTYSADTCDAYAAMQDLAYNEAYRYMIYEDSMITRDDEYYSDESLYSDWRSFHRDKLDEMCQIAGLDQAAYSSSVLNEKLNITESTYEVSTNYTYADATASNYYLRTEADPKKDEVYVYYAGKSNGYYKNGTITVVPAETATGYKIKSITEEDWNDEYTQELTDMEDEVTRLSDYGNATSVVEMSKALQEGAQYRIDFMNEKVSEAEEKYPEQKELIEQNQQAFMDAMEQEVEERMQTYYDTEGMGSAFMSPGAAHEITLREEMIKGRIYFIVMNLLMNDHLDALETPMDDSGTTDDAEAVDKSSDSSAKNESNYEVFTAEQIKTIREELNIPEDADVTCSVGEPIYWENNQIYVAGVGFSENGEYVAGADVNVDTLELVKSIVMYRH